MTFESEVVIDRPRERVLELIMEPGNFARWQPGRRGVSGGPRKSGARPAIHCQAGMH